MRLPAQPFGRVDTSAVSWVVGAILVSLAAGLAVAADQTAAMDVAAVGACAVLIALRPYAALLLLLLVRAGIATSPSSALLDFITLGAGTIAALLCFRRAPGRRVTVPFLAFLLVSLPWIPLLPSWDEGAKEFYLQLPIVHIIYARQPSNELLEFLRLAVALPVFVWAAWSVSSARQLRLVVGVTLAAAVYPIVDGLIDIATGQTHVRGGDFGSITGPFSHPNGFASYLTIVLVLAVVAFFEARTVWLRVGLGLLLGGGVACLASTYTRAAWVGFALAILLLGALRYRKLLVLGLTTLVIAAVVSPHTAHRAEQRFSDLSTQSEQYTRNSWKWRTTQWGRMVPYGLRRPVFGRGFGSYSRDTLLVLGTEDLQLSTKPRTPHGALGFGAHNDYVKSLVETGILGLVLWVLTLTGVMVVAARARRVAAIAPWATAVLTIAATLSLVSLADNIQTAPVDMVYLFGLAGAVVGVSARAKRLPATALAVEAPTAPRVPEPLIEPEPEPDAVPGPDPAPEPIAARRPPSGVRVALGRWLRRRGR